MPAYTFRSIGFVYEANNGDPTPGAPSGKTNGDLLLLATGARGASETVVTPTGWTLLKDTTSTANGSLALFGRIADGTSDDTPNPVDWSGTNEHYGAIIALYGDVYTDMATIVAHSNVAGSTGNTANVPNPSLTVTTDNTLIIGVGKKNKTATSNGASLTSPTGLDNRIDDSWPAGTRLGFVWDYTQQTTATNISASVWTQSVAESLPYASLIVSLKTQAALSPIVMRWRM